VNTPEDDQRELVDRAQAGEATAFERLAEQYAARLWRCALALCKDSHWAEDLVQETLVEAWQSLARFDGRYGGFSSWLQGRESGPPTIGILTICWNKRTCGWRIGGWPQFTV
jgi:hypothetical protein